MGKISIAGTRYINYNRSAYYDEGVKRSLDPLIVIVGHYLWMAVLYIAAGIYSRSNPLDVVKNYGPAYITAIGTMSSAATLAVALRCAKKSEPPLRDDMVYLPSERREYPAEQSWRRSV